MNIFPDYDDFLDTFENQGYQIKPLKSQDLEADGVIYLRHDIDFDCVLALELAKIEASRNIAATYFFMLTSDSYNLLSASNVDCVNEIRSLGHTVSIHFDPVRYSDFRKGLQNEVEVFASFFGIDVDFISLHRPNDFFLSFDQPIDNIGHTYQNKYIKDLKYVADSRGSFRYGAPQETEAFAHKKSIHLLIHPVWWTMPSTSPQKILDNFTLLRGRRFQDHIEANCKTYSPDVATLTMET